MKQARFRENAVLLFSSFIAAYLLSAILVHLLPESGKRLHSSSEHSRSFVTFSELSSSEESEAEWNNRWHPYMKFTSCTIESCFDLRRCMGDFKIYLYPPNTSKSDFISPIYRKILNVLENSHWLTQDPREACLFIPRLDTLDRDVLSPNFHPLAHSVLERFPYWYHLPTYRVIPHSDYPTASIPGQNHLLFNLYSGTWPDYTENDYRLPVGYAIIAQASVSRAHIRRNFDVSLPLFHPEYPEQSDRPSDESGLHNLFVRRPILLSFKGKRYLSGIGSASRNALFHLHNGDNIIMLTTCKHGTDWMRYMDNRCATDMSLYEKYDYNELMLNSTFCLVPRGRRLGSYRFLEVLRANCIPVLLGTDWELPFSEVIDWNEAVLMVDERALFTLPSTLRRIPHHQIVRMRQRIAFLWHTYFQSIELIVHTTLEIIRDRIMLNRRDHSIWNSPPGALILHQRHSVDECWIPSPHIPTHCQGDSTSGFTIVVPVRGEMCSSYRERVRLFAQTVFGSALLRKVLIVWICSGLPPTPDQFTSYIPVPTEIVVEDEFRSQLHAGKNPKPSTRFQPFLEIPTMAVFSFDLDLNLTKEEVEFAFSVWLEFPHRIVGFEAASHKWDSIKHLWVYLPSKATVANKSSYSIVLLNAAFYHRHYHYLYWHLFSPRVHDVVHAFGDCEEILFNVLVGHLSHTPPLQVFNRVPASFTSNTSSHQSACLQAFSEHLFDFLPYTPWPFANSVNGITTPQNMPYLPLYSSDLVISPIRGNQ